MKKLLIVGLIVVGGLFLFKKTNFASYVSTAWSKVKSGVKEQVPLEFEIDRVRHEIARLDDDMRNNLGPIAEEMANIKALRRKVQDTRASLQAQKANILAMTKQLEAGEKYISIGDEEYSADEVRARLDADFVSYKRCEAELKSQEKVLAAKEQSLNTVQQQLAGMGTLKRDLEVQVAQLEAELKTVRLAQTKDKYQLDDSRLSDIKNSLEEIRHRLDVERTRTELNGKFLSNPARLHHRVKPAGQLTREVKNYFGVDSKANGDKVASK